MLTYIQSISHVNIDEVSSPVGRIKEDQEHDSVAMFILGRRATSLIR
jgi:hypothetical protein